MNDYTRLIEFPKGWHLKTLQREYDEYKMPDGEQVYVTWWEGQAEGPNELIITVTGETKEEVLENILLAVNNERRIN